MQNPEIRFGELIYLTFAKEKTIEKSNSYHNKNAREKKMKKLLRLPILMLLIGSLAFLGCSDDDDDSPTNPNNNNDEFETALLDATSEYVYFDFATGETVTVNDPANSSDWHVAFHRDKGKINGGDFGPLGMQAVNLETIGNEYGMDFEGLVEVPAIEDDQWFVSELSLVFDGWYSYDPNTHTVSPSDRLFAVRDASGDGYGKIVVTRITAAGMGALGDLEVKFVHDTDGTDLSGAATTVDLSGDVVDNQVFFSFSEGGAVDIADPDNSTEWDLWFDGFDVKINGGVSGMGGAGVYPIYDETNDFDGLTTAPPDQGASYEQDAIASIFDDWYDYQGAPSHELLSKGHVYLLKVDDNTYFKMEIAGYYHPEDATSAWYTIHYKQL